MKGAIIGKVFIGIFFFMALPHLVRAGLGEPAGSIQFSPVVINALPTDTIIPKKKGKREGEKPATVIKIVPKARRQSIPIPVKVKVKPVKIIKPKIIKPVIKVIR